MTNDTEITSLKAIAKGAGIFFFGMMLSKVIAYLYRFYIARYFGPSDYGLFSIGLAVTGFVGVIALVGLNSGVNRYIAFYKARGDEERVKGVLTSSLKIVFPFSILLTIFLFILSPYLAVKIFHNPELINVFRILSVSIPFSSVTTIFLFAFPAFQKVEYQVYLSIFLNIAKVVTVIIFGLLGFKAGGIAWSWAIATILAFLISTYFLEKKVYPIFRNPVKAVPLKKKLLSFSLPLVLGSVASVVLGWTDTVALGYFKTSSDVGIYNVVIPTVQLLILIPAAFGTLFGPVFTGLYSKDKSIEMKKVYKTVTKWIFYINFPLFLLMVSFPKQILNIFFGYQYMAGYSALIILSFAHLVLSISLPGVSVLATLKKTKYITFNTIVVSLFNVLLNIYLIPIYGILGAAIATGISLLIGSLLTVLGAWYFFPAMPFSRSFLKPIFPGILSIGPIYFLAHYLTIPTYAIFLLFGLFLGLYGLLLLLVKGFDESDKEILRAFEKKFGFRIGFLRRFTS